MAISKLDKLPKSTWWTLVNGYSVTATKTVVNTINSRKISDCSAILILVSRGSIVRTSLVEPTLLFQNTGYHTSVFEVDSANAQRYYEIFYNSDTSVKINSSSNATGALIFIYGLALDNTF